MIWLVLAAAVVAVTAVLGASALRLDTAVPFLLAVYLFASAQVILLTELLSLLGLVRPAGYAVGETLLLAAAGAAWYLRGRPRPPLRRPALWVGARAHPLVAALAVVVGCAIVYEAVVIFSSPPNNWDSLSYHLSRAAGWYQRHRVEYFPAHTARENAFQPNSEMEILYTFVFAGRDTAAAATQLIAELALLLGVYGCARRVGFTRPASLFAALLSATMTEISLQSVTTQNDLLAASFLVAAACLALGETRTDLALAGLAVGLALGTKATVGAGLVLLALLVITKRPRWARLATLAAASAAAFLLVGFYGYGLNLVETGKLLGDPVAQGNTQPERITVGGTVSTAARVTFRLFDFSGFNPPEWIKTPVTSGGKHIFSAFGIPANPDEATQSYFAFRINNRVNEDVSYFGPLGFLLVLPLSIGFLVAGALRRAPPARVVLAAALPLFVLGLAMAFRYNLWLGRFMIAPVALTMVLAAFAYRSRPIAAALIVVGVLTLYYAQSRNEEKPPGIHGIPGIWGMGREQAQTLMQPDLTEVFQGVNRTVPADAKLGVVLRFDDWDFPLYGATLKRRLVEVPQHGMLPFAERNGIRWIVLNRDAVRPPPRAGWRSVDFHDSRWTLLSRTAG